MKQKDALPARLLVLTPLLGIAVFVILCFIASTLYPGGTNTDKTTKGFNWLTNYWCELLGDTGKNGDSNPAKPYAMTAMIILCFSLSMFWLYVLRLFSLTKLASRMVQLTGGTSMILSVFIFTDYHDLIINISGGLGLIALLLTFNGLYKTRLFKLFGFGLFCLVLIGINNYIYNTGHFLYALAVIQKVTFGIVLAWVAWIDIALFRRMNRPGD